MPALIIVCRKNMTLLVWFPITDYPFQISNLGNLPKGSVRMCNHTRVKVTCRHMSNCIMLYNIIYRRMVYKIEFCFSKIKNTRCVEFKNRSAELAPNYWTYYCKCLYNVALPATLVTIWILKFECKLLFFLRWWCNCFLIICALTRSTTTPFVNWIRVWWQRQFQLITNWASNFKFITCDGTIAWLWLLLK